MSAHSAEKPRFHSIYFQNHHYKFPDRIRENRNGQPTHLKFSGRIFSQWPDRHLIVEYLPLQWLPNDQARRPTSFDSTERKTQAASRSSLNSRSSSSSSSRNADSRGNRPHASSLPFSSPFPNLPIMDSRLSIETRRNSTSATRVSRGVQTERMSAFLHPASTPKLEIDTQ